MAAESSRAAAGGSGQAGAVPIPALERWYDYGVALLLQKDTARARRAFQQLIALHPDAVEGYTGLARVELQDGRPDGAVAALEQARQVQSRLETTGVSGGRRASHMRISALLGKALLKLGKYPEAVALLREVVRDYPQDKAVWLDLGYAWFQQNRLDEAVAAFKQVLVIDPDEQGAHAMLARSYRALGRTREARLAQETFDALREDVSVQGLRQKYLERHPEAALESNLSHVHEVIVSDGAPVAHSIP